MFSWRGDVQTARKLIIKASKTIQGQGNRRRLQNQRKNISIQKNLIMGWFRKGDRGYWTPRV